MSFLLHRTVKSTLVSEIRDDIVRGTYQPGQRLRLHELAKRFEVSNMPVREALRHLETEGIVTNIPHKGAYVTTLSADEMEDIYDIRTELETLATRLAIPNITAENLAQLTQCVAAMDDHMDHVATFVKLNHEFHTSLYAVSQRPHLCELITTMRYRMHHYLRVFQVEQGNIVQIQAEHRALLAACAASDSERAAALMHDHVSTVGQNIVAHLRQADEGAEDDVEDEAQSNAT